MLLVESLFLFERAFLLDARLFCCRTRVVFDMFERAFIGCWTRFFCFERAFIFCFERALFFLLNARFICFVERAFICVVSVFFCL